MVKIVLFNELSDYYQYKRNFIQLTSLERILFRYEKSTRCRYDHIGLGDTNTDLLVTSVCYYL